jgi:hypothetical protein
MRQRADGHAGARLYPGPVQDASACRFSMHGKGNDQAATYRDLLHLAIIMGTYA